MFGKNQHGKDQHSTYSKVPNLTFSLKNRSIFVITGNGYWHFLPLFSKNIPKYDQLVIFGPPFKNLHNQTDPNK